MDVRVIGDTPNGSVTGLSVYNATGAGSNIKSIQRGETVLSSATIDVPITAIDLTKSVVMLSGYSSNSSPANSLISGELTTSTNLRLRVNTAAANPKTAWQVIEFNNVKSKQSGITSLPSATTNQAITAVNTAKSVLYVSFTSNSASTTGHNNNAELTSSTNINFEINDATVTGYWQVIEFN